MALPSNPAPAAAVPGTRHIATPAPDGAPVIRQREVPPTADIAERPAPAAQHPPAGPVPPREQVAAEQEEEAPANRLDMAAVLAAVREVPGVHDAVLRREPGGGQTLRLDLAEAVDPRAVEREVAELLRARLGVNAAPAPPPGAATTAPAAAEAERDDPADAQVGVAGGAGQVAQGDSDVDTSRAAASNTHHSRRGGTDIATSDSDHGGADRRHGVSEIVAAPVSAGSDGELTAAGTGAVASAPQATRRLDPLDRSVMRVVLERVQVVTAGLEAAVEVGLAVGGIRAVGRAAGPAVEEHVLRAAVAATTDAVDVLLAGRARCAMEHVGTYHASTTEVALVVVMLLSPGGPERLTGAAAVNGDARQAAARATLAALNRRLAALLP